MFIELRHRLPRPYYHSKAVSTMPLSHDMDQSQQTRHSPNLNIQIKLSVPCINDPTFSTLQNNSYTPHLCSLRGCPHHNVSSICLHSNYELEFQYNNLLHFYYFFGPKPTQKCSFHLMQRCVVQLWALSTSLKNLVPFFMCFYVEKEKEKEIKNQKSKAKGHCDDIYTVVIDKKERGLLFK